MAVNRNKAKSKASHKFLLAQIQRATLTRHSPTRRICVPPRGFGGYNPGYMIIDELASIDPFALSLIGLSIPIRKLPEADERTKEQKLADKYYQMSLDKDKREANNG